MSKRLRFRWKHSAIALALLLGGTGVVATVLAAPGGDTAGTESATSVSPSSGDASAAKNAIPAPPAPSPIVAVELDELKATVEAQTKQYAADSKELETERAALNDELARIENLESKLGITTDPKPSSLTLSNSSAASAIGSAAVPAASSSSQPSATPSIPAAAAQTDAGPDQTAASPLFFRIGRATFTPGGFLDLTGIFRSTNSGTGLGTSFSSIPYSSTLPQGRLSEYRFTAAGSRLSLGVNADVSKNTAVTGYVEADFNGYQPANANTETNGDSLRLRLAWARVTHGKWEVLAGQSWSLITPDRTGLSPLPADIFLAQRVDTNYVIGFAFARQPGIRVTYHPTHGWWIGASAENPQQYVPSSVVFPGGTTGATYFGNQFDNGSSSTSGSGAATNDITPNLFPDIIVKTAVDAHVGGKLLHGEVGGIVRGFKDFDDIITPAPGATNTVIGGGVFANANLEVLKGFRLIVNSTYGDGVGRYLDALGPDVIVKEDGRISAVHSGGGVGGFEYQVTPSILFDAYYGAAYFARNYSEVTPVTTPATYVGFGFIGSANTNNRLYQDATVGFIGNLWSNATFGKLQIILQPAWVVRDPWYHAATAPKDAHQFITFIDLRYIIP